MMHGHNDICPITLTEHLFLLTPLLHIIKFGANIGFVYKFLLEFPILANSILRY
jgi:hypothetical protein